MAGLREGGNEPPGSLKANKTDLDPAPKYAYVIAKYVTNANTMTSKQFNIAQVVMRVTINPMGPDETEFSRICAKAAFQETASATSHKDFISMEISFSMKVYRDLEHKNSKEL
ncbi:hypothetical protein ANN_15354 [Periplaneta americana]|uniref:Uncharacterized protein n=1 Tax=Periplaneta americana TaxID=6978 RepID=A0ABQ8SHA3_PERAM|nr:hypothetical protein ANN_15354 [Periplaneta americana]